MDKLFSFTAIFILLVISNLHSRSFDGKLKIYFLCQENTKCDQNYLISTLTDFSFVRDRFSCDFQIVQSQVDAGINSVNVSLFFLGYNKFENLRDTINYNVEDFASSNDVYRKKLIEMIYLGIKKLEAQVTNEITNDTLKVPNDKFKNWQFSESISGYFAGDQNSSSSSLKLSSLARRETLNHRLGCLLYFDFNKDKFTFESVGDSGNDTIIQVIAKRNVKQISFEFLKKINGHWATGFRSSFYESEVANIKRRLSYRGLIEYSIFDYSEFTSNRIYLDCEIGTEVSKYVDTTIYLKLNENRMYNIASIQSSFTKPWGTMNFGCFFKYYLSDLRQNSLYLGTGVEWSVFKGLNLSLSGSYQFIHDQISLPKDDVTLEDLLTQRRLIFSNFDFDIYIGLSYTFGSIYSPQVSPFFRDFNF